MADNGGQLLTDRWGGGAERALAALPGGLEPSASWLTDTGLMVDSQAL